jgi:hypothetical protein
MTLSQYNSIVSSIRAGAISPQNVSDVLNALGSNPPYNTTGLLKSEPEFVFVKDKSDLPLAVGGVIHLEDNATYFFITEVDLTGDRLVGGVNTTILGGSSENCRIKSTGLTDALITSQYSLPIRGITIEASLALDLDGDGVNTALDWFGVNFTDCAVVGTVKDYSNFIMTDCAFLNSSGLTLDGTIGTVGFGTCLFDGNTGGTIITIPSTATISRRFRVIYSSFIAGSGETALNVSTSASIPAEGYILDTCNFAGGGTYTAGVQVNDNKARHTECRGVPNSASIGYYTMNGNAVASDVITQGVAVKVAGTTTAQGITQRFTHTNNRLTYSGALTRNFRVSGVLSFTSGANDKIGVYVAKNGTPIANSEIYSTANTAGRSENVTAQALVELATNDYVEIWVENDTDTDDITVSDLSVIIEATT